MGMRFDSKHDFAPHTHLVGASPLPLDVGYLFLVGSNILLLKVVQRSVVISDFSQEKISGLLLVFPLASKLCKPLRI